jgi:hypothetical protein
MRKKVKKKNLVNKKKSRMGTHPSNIQGKKRTHVDTTPKQKQKQTINKNLLKKKDSQVVCSTTGCTCKVLSKELADKCVWNLFFSFFLSFIYFRVPPPL